MATRSADQPVALAMDAVGSQMFSQENTRAGVTARRSAMYWIPLERILDNPYQPRQGYAADYVVSLAQSIADLKRTLPATLGLQQVPLARVVTVDGAGVVDLAPRLLYGDESEMRRLLNQPDTRVQLMFGHRRLRAFQVLASGKEAVFGPTSLEGPEPDAAYGEMPVMLQFAMDADVWRMAMTENSQREGLSAIEEANALQRAIDEFGWTLEEAGRPFGYRNRSSVSNKLRLLRLPPEVQAMVASGQLSERAARELLRLDDHPDQLMDAAAHAVREGWSVAGLGRVVDAKLLNLKWDAERAERKAADVEPGESLDALPVEDSVTSRCPLNGGAEAEPTAEAAPAAVRPAVETVTRNEAWAIWDAAFSDDQPAWDDPRLWHVLAGRKGFQINPWDWLHHLRTEQTTEGMRRLIVRVLFDSSATYVAGGRVEYNADYLRRLISALQGA